MLDPSPKLEAVATRRERSLISGDLHKCWAKLNEGLTDRKVLIIGGAGSIGSATVRLLMAFSPAAVHIVDISENALAELVRDLRSSPDIALPHDLRFLPIDYGAPVMARLLHAEDAYDAVLVFAAHKHVRSEKDVPSVLQMFDTNVVKLRRFLGWLEDCGHSSRCFVVSTDKAANPTSLMGASKRLMEHVLFANSGIQFLTSARFANVAFSNGSLLQSFLIRLSKRQPLAAPRDILRYFMTSTEAAEICLLAAFATPSRHLLFPELDPSVHLVALVDIAKAVLAEAGFAPTTYTNDAEAVRALADDVKRRCYPLIVTPPDTSGEKPFEEFLSAGEVATEVGFGSLLAVQHSGVPDNFADTIQFIERVVADPSISIAKADIVASLSRAIPELDHKEAARSLDERA